MTKTTFSHMMISDDKEKVLFFEFKTLIPLYEIERFPSKSLQEELLSVGEQFHLLYQIQHYTYQHYGDSSHEDCFSKSYPCYIKSPHSLPIRSSLKSMP